MLDLMPDPTGTIETDPRWGAVRNRATGDFVYGVKTTGIYCRSTCPSRLPKPKNIVFYASCSEAEAAGFRPCLRCKPLHDSHEAQKSALMADICRIIEQSEQAPRLDDLAAQARLSPHHFHRSFKAITGLTPKAYFNAQRAKRVREGLSAGDTVTAVLYGAGFGSSGRFYETSNAILGMTPTRFQKGGAGADIRFAVGQCALGAILVAQSDIGICSITLGDDAEALVNEMQDRFPYANLIGGDTVFEALVAKVAGFVETPVIGLDLPLDIRGTAFQQRVWKALQAIPSGQTRSYSDIAALIGEPKSVRAVASACGANTLAVAIPCHRVVRTDGALSGYRWGVERKRALLLKEGHAA